MAACVQTSTPPDETGCELKRKQMCSSSCRLGQRAPVGEKNTPLTSHTEHGVLFTTFGRRVRRPQNAPHVEGGFALFLVLKAAPARIQRTWRECCGGMNVPRYCYSFESILSFFELGLSTLLSLLIEPGMQQVISLSFS